MHKIQEKILNLANTQDLGKLSLREIGRLAGDIHPNNVRHHLNQLERSGFILRDEKNIKPVRRGRIKNTPVFAIPILGLADCGTPVSLAEESFEGFLNVSDKLLSKKEGIFAIKAQGDSMNKAQVGSEKNNIEDGDYILVDGDSKDIKNGDYVVAAVDEVAAIKRVIKEERRVILVSESTQNYAPIYLHPDDNFIINGKVIQVIKKPNAGWVLGGL